MQNASRNNKMLCSVLAAMLALGVAAPAFADHKRHRYDDDYYRRHGWYSHHHSWYRKHPAFLILPEQQEYYYVTNPYGYPVPPPGGMVTTITCRDEYDPLPFVLGTAAGGAIGSTIGKGRGRTAAIISGAVIGGVLGSRYTSYERRCVREVFESVPVGQVAYWTDPGTQYAYAITPTRDFQQSGRYCREYQAVATVGGRKQQTYGTACMQPDGSWQVVN